MNDLVGQVRQEIFERGLLRRGQAVMVAVSGGVDSMVLLHVLNHLSKAERWRLTVAHLNHGLRGASSDADERLVKRTAERLELPFVASKVDVATYAREQRLSLEMAARELRHSFFATQARRLHLQTLALAQHADDQLELFFLRLLRGSGGGGLAGMKWASPSAFSSALILVRPLLGVRKTELMAFAQKEKIRFRHDRTNDSQEILRNRVRHELLPLLRREYQPALDKVIERVIDLLSAESELATEIAQNWLAAHSPQARRSPREEAPVAKDVPFTDLPVAIQRKVIWTQLLGFEIEPDYELVEKLRDKVGASVSVAGEGQLLVSRDREGALTVRKKEELAFPVEDEALQVDLERSESVRFGGAEIGWRKTSHLKTQVPGRLGGLERFDAEMVGAQITLRHWRAGDRFQPSGMKKPVKLQDLFVNARIPKARRHRLIVAATSAGEIFWVEGLRIAERFKLSGNTRQRLEWRWKRADL